VRDARYAVVQAAWTFEDAVDLFPDWLSDEHARKEHIAYRTWQINVRALVLKGYSVNRARDIVDGRDTEDAVA
jgi:hypothetical protein